MGILSTVGALHNYFNPCYAVEWRQPIVGIVHKERRGVMTHETPMSMGGHVTL